MPDTPKPPRRPRSRPATSALETEQRRALRDVIQTTQAVLFGSGSPPDSAPMVVADAPTIPPPPPPDEAGGWMPGYWLEKYRDPIDEPTLTRVASPHAYFLQIHHEAAWFAATAWYDHLRAEAQARHELEVRLSRGASTPYERWRLLRETGTQNSDHGALITLSDVLVRERDRERAARIRYLRVLQAIMAEPPPADFDLAIVKTAAQRNAARAVAAWIAERTPSRKPHWPDVAIAMWFHGWPLDVPFAHTPSIDNPVWRRLGHALEVEVSRANAARDEPGS